MAQTITLAYNGTGNTHHRVLASAISGYMCYLAIQPTTKLLGVILGQPFQSSGVVIADNTWVALACTIDGYTVTLYANGSRVASFTSTIPLSSCPVDRIGNLDSTHIVITSGLAPSLTLTPSLTLAPSSGTRDTQGNANGTIDEVQRYNRVLPDYEIAAIAKTSTLYESIPNYPLADGYNDSPLDNIISTNMSAGPIKSRLRSTVAPRYIDAQYYLDINQKQIHEQFYQSTGGVNSFYWTTPDTGEVLTVRFKPGARPRYQVEGLGYRVFDTFEVIQ